MKVYIEMESNDGMMKGKSDNHNKSTQKPSLYVFKIQFRYRRNSLECSHLLVLCQLRYQGGMVQL